MIAADMAGWFAASLTLMTFCCRDMARLRVLALCANAAFITYAWLAGLTPVLALHLALAPVNAWRLVELVRSRRPRKDMAVHQAPGRDAPRFARRAWGPALGRSGGHLPGQVGLPRRHGFSKAHQQGVQRPHGHSRGRSNLHPTWLSEDPGRPQVR